jgi:uncharacterized RDD family membrane protein YckC
VRGVPSRISPESYPIAATAAAPAYEFEPAIQAAARATEREPEREPDAGQQPLFESYVAEPRVIPFDSLTTTAQRESIRSRATDLFRPAPLKTARVEIRHARPQESKSRDQRTLDFQGQQAVLTQPESNIICDAPVAPAGLRVEAALIDGLLVLCGYAFGTALFLYEGGRVSADKHVLPFLLFALATVPLFYKLLWVFVGRDSIGMARAGIRLVDFDGNPPSQARRYQRFFGSILSLLAAGVGLVWALVDEDRLTWHDHVSSTFPTIDAPSV